MPSTCRRKGEPRASRKIATRKVNGAFDEVQKNTWGFCERMCLSVAYHVLRVTYDIQKLSLVFILLQTFEKIMKSSALAKVLLEGKKYHFRRI